MVIVRLRGDLGNQMFQYAMGRIIAEKKGYSLFLDESEDGWKNVLYDYFPNVKLIKGKEIKDNMLMIGPNRQHIDLEEVIKHEGLIFLHGYWQKHYLYTQYMPQLKEWFSYDDSIYDKPDENDIVVHCRLAKLDEHKIMPPIKTFVNIVNTLQTSYRKCIVLTDEINNPLLNEFKCIKNVFMKSGERMEDFTFMKYAKRLIISQSTFSWWASFLGTQSKVYAPLTITNTPNYWKATPELLHDTDLVPNNQKYLKFYI